MNNKILITGSAGFIGFSVAELFLKKKYNVVGIDNLSNYYSLSLKKKRIKILNKYKNFKFIKADISHKKILYKCLKNYKFNYVYHFAAQPGVRYSLINPKIYYETNVKGFINLIETLKKEKLKKISSFKELSSKIDLSKNYLNLPYKNASYIKKRYFQHPIYKYDIYLILKNKLVSRSFIVTREVFYKSNKALSIIDFVGEKSDLSKIGNSLNEVMIKNNYEYIDILCTNIKRKTLNNSNFVYKFEKDKNIIPIYFQPFVKKNTTIWYESSKKKIILFKGDADQDTPRELEFLKS